MIDGEGRLIAYPLGETSTINDAAPSSVRKLSYPASEKCQRRLFRKGSGTVSENKKRKESTQRRAPNPCISKSSTIAKSQSATLHLDPFTIQLRVKVINYQYNYNINISI